MCESYSKSKLKRKKCSFEELRQDSCCSGTLKESSAALSFKDATERTARSLAVSWWNREPLSAVESLWALTLKSTLPYLDSQSWDLVPDLPDPSAARPATQTLNEQEWFDLSNNEVPPFPEFSPPSSPSARPSPTTGPLGLSSSHQELPVQNKSVSNNLDREVSSHSGQTSDCTNLQNQGEASDHPDPLEEEGDHDGMEEVHRGGSTGGGGLQSCPMCLLVFPVGFTQMDCDGHLAQCLSEMNVDMTW